MKDPKQNNNSNETIDYVDSNNHTYSLEMEQELLGALLRDNTLLEEVSDFLKAEHFYLAVNRLIYEYISKFINEGLIASPATLKYILESEPVFQKSNGENYLQELMTNVVTTINVSYHGNEIFNLARRRILIKEIGKCSVQAQNDLSEPIDSIIEGLEASLDNITNKGIVTSQPEELNIFTNQVRLNIKARIDQEQFTSVSSGFADIDGALGGFHNSDLIILAGRPGMGKTAMATQIATKAANKIRLAHNKDKYKHKNNHIVIFSLEMSGEELAMRILCEKAGFAPSKFRRTYSVGINELNQVTEADKFVSKLPIMIDDTPYLTMYQIRQRARKIKKNYGLAMIIIDYLQLLQSDNKAKNSDNRVYEISEISRGLKNLAKEMEVPVIALSQLNRKSEDRDDPRPQLSDLRDSGSIEQDADIVMFLFREYYYLKGRNPKKRARESKNAFLEREEEHIEKQQKLKNDAELIVAKNRHGEQTTITLNFKEDLVRFSDEERKNYNYEDIQ